MLVALAPDPLTLARDPVPVTLADPVPVLAPVPALVFPAALAPVPELDGCFVSASLASVSSSAGGSQIFFSTSHAAV